MVQFLVCLDILPLSGLIKKEYYKLSKERNARPSISLHYS